MHCLWMLCARASKVVEAVRVSGMSVAWYTWQKETAIDAITEVSSSRKQTTQLQASYACGHDRRFCHDKDYVIRAVSTCGHALKDVPWEFKKDRDVVLAAVKKAPFG